MKTLLAAALILGFAVPTFADIQDPPSREYGPTRKFGRGLSNAAFCLSEFPVQIARVNDRLPKLLASPDPRIRAAAAACGPSAFRGRIV
jgi:hypothetical protein